MTSPEFTTSLSANKPPDQLSPYLQALWYDAKGDWGKAHRIIQELPDENASWIHAYLQRREGDTFNAGYWYRKAKKTMPAYSLQEEWEEIVAAML